MSINSESSKSGFFFKKRLQEAGAILLIAAGLYILLALYSYHPDDPSWANTQPHDSTRNLGGLAGAWLSYSLYFLFGGGTFLLPVIMFGISLQVFRHRESSLVAYLTQGVGFLFLLLTACGLAAMHFLPGKLPVSAGGYLGESMATGFISVFGLMGATLLLLALLIGSVHLITKLSWLHVMDTTGAFILRADEWIGDYVRRFRKRKANFTAQGIHQASSQRHKTEPRPDRQKAPRVEPRVGTIKAGKRAKQEKQPPLFVDRGNDVLPPLNCLDLPAGGNRGMAEKAVETLARQLELKLADFGVDAEVTNAQSGPVITRFELTLSPGTKASRITSLEKDLARALLVPSVRIVEIIPGRATVGVEVPNEKRETVLLSEILGSEAYDKENSPLTLGLGKDIAGAPVLANLGLMPHLLVAGTTGSGKSVAVHSMLMSILFKASPRQVRLILIDPKMLELNAYDGIPHLLVPVITDMKHAASALHWVIAEMQRRYRLMSALGVRNTSGYNSLIERAVQESRPIRDPLAEQERTLPLEAMPYVVIVIDEFADMMMVVGKRVEELIVRLAQKARAAGIHLLLATQRPSVDVITGLIKANIPARIAFQVSSKIDSRTILDQNGAEQLLGQGDMLYVPPGAFAAKRIHGAFVSDREVHAVTELLKRNGPPDYLDFEKTGPEGTTAGEGDAAGSEPDPLYDQAVELVLETRKTSISYIQRRLRIGYNRAARIVEDMEAAGVVSQLQENGVREVLSSPRT